MIPGDELADRLVARATIAAADYIDSVLGLGQLLHFARSHGLRLRFYVRHERVVRIDLVPRGRR